MIPDPSLSLPLPPSLFSRVMPDFPGLEEADGAAAACPRTLLLGEQRPCTSGPGVRTHSETEQTCRRVHTCAITHVWGCSGAPSFLPDRAPALHRHAPLGPSHHGARPQPAELPSCGRGTPARIGSPARPGRRTPAPGASPLLPPPSRSSGSASAALKGPEHERGAPPRPPTPPRGTARLPRPQPSPLPPPSAQPHSASRAAPPHPPPAAPPQPQINTHARREVISKCRFILVCTTSL